MRSAARLARSGPGPVADARLHASVSRRTPLDRALQSFAQTPLGGKLFIHVFPAIDRRLIPLSRASFDGPGSLRPVHTIGAKSGLERDIPLLATKHGEQFLLVASKAGAPKHPAWLYNLRAHPDVEVTFDGERQPMRAGSCPRGPSATSCGPSSATTTAATRPTSGARANGASRSSR